MQRRCCLCATAAPPQTRCSTRRSSLLSSLNPPSPLNLRLSCISFGCHLLCYAPCSSLTSTSSCFPVPARLVTPYWPTERPLTRHITYCL
eukprot:1158743-Pelagomonas_calceolata.AAC.8